jgi:hypothetical protein
LRQHGGSRSGSRSSEKKPYSIRSKKIKVSLLFLNKTVEAEIENDECGQVGENNLNITEYITEYY